MELKEVIPAKEIQARFKEPLDINECGFAELNRLIDIIPKDIHATSLNVWNRIVQYNLKPVNPMAISEWVDAKDPSIFKKIEQIIHQTVIKDALYYSADYRGRNVAQVILFRVFPNSLHLADIFFCNPFVPLPRSQQTRFRKHKGFGLLSTVLANMRAYADEHHIDYLTLTAAFGDLVPLFEKHGFAVENNAAGRYCLRTGLCIPMELKL